MGLVSLLRKEESKLGFKLGEAIGYGGMSEGVFRMTRTSFNDNEEVREEDSNEDQLAVKICCASKEPFLLSEEAMKVFPVETIVPVYVDYNLGENNSSSDTPTSFINILNEDRTNLGYFGSHLHYVFGQNPHSKQHDFNLEFMLQRLVAGRDCQRRLEDAEKQKLSLNNSSPNSSNLKILAYKGYQFFTGLGYLGHALITEYVNWPTLSALLEKESKNEIKIPETAKYYIASQLCEVLELLKAKQILHKDLKSENILVDPRTYNLKTLDFDLAIPLTDERHDDSPEDVSLLLGKDSLINGSLVGTPFYLAPETIQCFREYTEFGQSKIKLTTAADVFSVGRIFAEMFGAFGDRSSEFQQPLRQYTEEDRLEVMNKLKEKNVYLPIVLVIGDMLHQNPALRRYNAAQELFSALAKGNLQALPLDMNTRAIELFSEAKKASSSKVFPESPKVPKVPKEVTLFERSEYSQTRPDHKTQPELIDLSSQKRSRVTMIETCGVTPNGTVRLYL